MVRVEARYERVYVAHMTNTPEIPPSRDGAKLILFVAYPDMGLLDLTGPHTAFWAATEAREKRGSPGYVRQTASLTGGLVRSAEGLALDTRPLGDFADATIDTLIVPGSPRIEQVLPREAALVRWLLGASARARRTASVCSGAFLLAEAGLLHDRRAATHWAMCDMLQRRFPAVTVDRDAIFIRQDPVWTSAGVTAGIDLSLALIEDDCGHDVAMDVARELVVFLKRPGGQSQFSETLQAQADDSETFEKLHLWLLDNLGGPLSVEILAERVNMSPRHFSRVYRQKTGRTPAKAVEVFRLEAARRMLEQSPRHIDQIARQCGFGDEERMRVTFQRNLGVAPRDYRRRFAV